MLGLGLQDPVCVPGGGGGRGARRRAPRGHAKCLGALRMRCGVYDATADLND